MVQYLEDEGAAATLLVDQLWGLEMDAAGGMIGLMC